MTRTARQLERLLAELRPDYERWQTGRCYHPWKVVRTVFPEAECHYSRLEGHVYIRFEGKFYDIRGRAFRTPRDLSPLIHNEGHRPHRWGRRNSQTEAA